MSKQKTLANGDKTSANSVRRNSVRRLLGVFVLVTSIAAVSALPVRPLFILGCVSLIFLPVLASEPMLRLPVVLMAIGNLASAVSLLANDTSWSFYPAMTFPRLLVYFCAIWLVQKIFALTWRDLLFGTILGVACFWLEINDKDSLGAIWKYCIGVPVSTLIFLLLEKWRTNRALLIVVGTLLIVVSLVFTSRALALQIAIAGFIWLMSDRKKGSTKATVTVQFVLLMGLSVFAIGVISKLGSAGVFGSALQQSFQGNSGRSENLILGGRSELPISIATILQKPFLGYGENPAPNSDILQSAYELAIRMGININSATYRVWVNPVSGEVTPHSMLLEAWVESGVVSVLLLLVLLFFGIRILTCSVLGGRVPLAFLFLFFVLLWDSFFSPFLTGRDILYALLLFWGAHLIVESRAGHEPNLLRSFNAG